LETIVKKLNKSLLADKHHQIMVKLIVWTKEDFFFLANFIEIWGKKAQKRMMNFL